ncbi:nuclear transport factor 2-like protein [Thalassotalea hakodatensis]|uniref:hypothetical protein n=1 Tax=Thalassotalea hakodatensis TaxID=3030492 RepID=UPI002572B6E9|nr:hypothetical protein [Thalassotalea hakodatensis]
MKLTLSTIYLLTLLFYSNFSIAQECNETCQVNAVTAYFSALDKVAKKDSTAKDIDAFLALMHSDVKYVHVEYGAKFDLVNWREAFLRNLDRGMYQNTDQNEQRIIKYISGKSYIAVEYSHGIIQNNEQWEATEPLLVIFAFTEGKISLIKELW